jgi:hypothetical protein
MAGRLLAARVVLFSSSILSERSLLSLKSEGGEGSSSHSSADSSSFRTTLRIFARRLCCGTDDSPRNACCRLRLRATIVTAAVSVTAISDSLVSAAKGGASAESSIAVCFPGLVDGTSAGASELCKLDTQRHGRQFAPLRVGRHL